MRVVKLTDITVQPDAVFKIGEEEEEEEGGKGDQEALERGATPPGVLDQSGWLLDRSGKINTHENVSLKATPNQDNDVAVLSPSGKRWRRGPFPTTAWSTTWSGQAGGAHHLQEPAEEEAGGDRDERHWQAEGHLLCGQKVAAPFTWSHTVSGGEGQE